VPALTAADADAFAACVAGGGVAVFPADTVYGLACDPENPSAVARLYELKGRPPDKPAAVMWFDRDEALAALPELGPRTRDAFGRLTPGGVTLLVPNPRGRFPLAGGSPALGIRLPKLTGDAEALQLLRLVVLQSSANHAAGPDAKRVEEVPEAIRRRADLVLDAGRLPGTPSTVIDLRDYEAGGAYAIIREGAVPAATIAAALR
jgi:L-threonylcarbamoyladenylate synthase